jgi:hypothetical protein
VAVAGPDWVPTAITAVSTVSAAAIGGLAGYLGAARASKQAVAIAREQRRYERVHEMRSEVLPTLYADLRTLHDIFKSITRTPLGTANEEGNVDLNQVSERYNQMLSSIQQLDERLGQISEYYKLHILWIPDEVSTPISTAFDGFKELLRKVSQIQEKFGEHLNEISQQMERQQSQIKEAEGKLSQLRDAEMKSQAGNEIRLSREVEEAWEKLSEIREQIDGQLVRAVDETDALRGEMQEWLRTEGEEQLQAVRVSAENVLTA